MPAGVAPLVRVTVDPWRLMDMPGAADPSRWLALSMVMMERRPTEQTVLAFPDPGLSSSRTQRAGVQESTETQAEGNEPLPSYADPLDALFVVAVALAAPPLRPERETADTVFAEMAH
jgi:hypothetical protein